MNLLTQATVENLRKALAPYAKATLFVSPDDLSAYGHSHPYDSPLAITADPATSFCWHTEHGPITLCVDLALTAGNYRLEFGLQ